MKQDYKGINQELYEALTDSIRPAKMIRFIAVARWGKRIDDSRPAVICPYCNSSDHTVFLKNIKRYSCSKCREVFSSLYSTMFYNSNLDLRKWVIFLMLKGNIPSVRILMKDLQISNTTAQVIINKYKNRTDEDDKLIHSIIQQVEKNIKYWEEYG